MPRVVQDPMVCTGCKVCQLICSFVHYKVANPRKSRIGLLREKGGADKALICVHCPNPACMKACAQGAIYRDKKGLIRVNKKKCIECLKCVKACPFHAMFYHPDVGVINCEVCGECVKRCPVKALKIVK